MLKHKNKPPVFWRFFSAKYFLISLMVTTFMVFASGTTSVKEIDNIISIIIGAGLFTVAAGLLLYAADISRKSSKNLYQ